MVKLRNMLAGFGAGLIVASVSLQLTQATAETKPAAPSSGDVQLDETKVKQWAESNGYQLVKKDPKAASNPSPAASQTSTPAPSQAPSAAPVQTPAVSAPVSPASPKSVTIPDGISSTQVGEILSGAGIIDKAAFDQSLKQAQATTKLRSGTYSFTPGEKPESIIDKLTKIPAE
ncbi:hypothetical protein [Paenibacillus sp. MBLB4367]|uniref:hypothetical protein n=1 Tax=Paenibacillus sp. MBLB4367 TaxID=3384767 RepID=UPI003908360F